MKLEEVSKSPNAILIHSGIVFDVFEPKAENIKLIDIAHALSNICRYGGHSPSFYSVAQHSVLCSEQPGTPQEQLEFLMHDASEAFLVDLPRPIKSKMPDYRRIEDNLLALIFDKFELTFPLSDRVHEVDDYLLRFEYNEFFTNPNKDFKFWSPVEAKENFIKRYEILKAKIG